VDQYILYVQNLRTRGFSDNQIRSTLQAHGLKAEMIDQILEKSAPGTESQQKPDIISSNVPFGQASPPPTAYLDYVKALLKIGKTPQEIDANLAQYGVPPDVRKSVEESAAQASMPQNYPSMQRTNTVRGQAPANIILPKDPLSRSKNERSRVGWMVTIVSCLIPSLIIAFDQPDRFSNTVHTLLTLSDIFATIGLCLYVIDLVLATRLAIIENMFGGLNKVYIAHAIIGSAALTAIMLHPILLAIRFYPLGYHTVASFFIPTTKYLSSAFGIFGLALMLVLLMITFYTHLPYKVWLATHKYLGLAYLLICIHVLFTANTITENLVVKLYLIFLLGLGLAAFVYRTILPNILVRHYVYLLHTVTEKSKGVIEVELVPTSKVMHFTEGQFVFMSFQADGLSPEWHPFTIASAPSDSSMSIAIKSLGGYTETLTRLLPHMIGMSVLIEGAYGRFSFRNFKNVNQIWIAGGIGITPFLSMAQNLGKGPYNIDLYYSVRSEAELFDLEALVAATHHDSDKQFRVFPFVTEKYNRHLSVDLIASTSLDILSRDFLICGPERMMKSMKQDLIKAGVKRHKIHCEEFSIT
jgi:predicted ferric reductase